MTENDIEKLKQEITKLQLENLELKLASINTKVDPRYVAGKSLPTDSRPIFKYNDRCYATTAYPGFVWHLGSWFSTNDIKPFIPVTPSRITDFESRQSTYVLKKTSTHNTNVTSAYLPIYMDSYRTFITLMQYVINNYKQCDSCNYEVIDEHPLANKARMILDIFTGGIISDAVYIVYDPVRETFTPDITVNNIYPEDLEELNERQCMIIKALWGNNCNNFIERYIKKYQPNIYEAFKKIK